VMIIKRRVFKQKGRWKRFPPEIDQAAGTDK